MSKTQEQIMADESHVEHMFLQVESNDVVCVLNVAGHPYRLRELIYMMVENGCRVVQTTAEFFNLFEHDKETVEVHDFLTSIIKAKFV